MQLQFGPFRLNTETYELLNEDERIAVEPLVFDLIAYLASKPKQLISREDLLEAVWQGRIVSDSTISTCVKNARKTLGDTGDNQHFIQTVRGRGYRFTAVVSEITPTSVEAPAFIPAESAPMQADPSLLIRPFKCLNEEPELQLLSASLSANINTVLTRIPLLNISTETACFLNDKIQPSGRDIHDVSGVNFIFEGSVQLGASGARVNAQLTDAKTGYNLWAETFELHEPLTQALDTCVSAIVAKLEPQLHRRMYQLVRSHSGRPTARQLFLEASGLLVLHGWNHESFSSAGDILLQSTELDPGLAQPHALRSLLFGFGSRIGLMVDKQQAKDTARQHAEQALLLDSMDSTTLGLAGCSLADIGDLQRGESLLNAAIDINASNAQAWVALGAVLLAKEDAPLAVEKLSHGISISPMDSRLSVWGSLLSAAHLLSGELEAAAETAELACRRHDRTYLPRVSLAASRFMQGDKSLALQAMNDARRIKPDLNRQQISGIAGRLLSRKLEKL